MPTMQPSHLISLSNLEVSLFEEETGDPSGPYPTNVLLLNGHQPLLSAFSKGANNLHLYPLKHWLFRFG